MANSLPSPQLRSHTTTKAELKSAKVILRLLQGFPILNLNLKRAKCDQLAVPSVVQQQVARSGVPPVAPPTAAACIRRLRLQVRFAPSAVRPAAQQVAPPPARPIAADCIQAKGLSVKFAPSAARLVAQPPVRPVARPVARPIAVVKLHGGYSFNKRHSKGGANGSSLLVSRHNPRHRRLDLRGRRLWEQILY